MRTSKVFTGTTMIVAVLLISAGLAVAAPPTGVGNQGQAGNSNVYHCDLLAGEAVGDNGHGSGKVHARYMDGAVAFTVNAWGLTPGVEYEVRSGGALTPVVSGFANGGGNLTLVGVNDDWGTRFNLWEDGDVRIMRTLENCLPDAGS